MVKIYHSLDEIPPAGGLNVTLTIGFFDGVHIGHQQLLNRVGEYREPGVQISGLVTFEPHPLAVLAPDKAPALLSPPQEKLQILSGYNLSYILVMKFDRALAATPAEDFVKKVLVEKLQVKKVIVGYDTTFGRGGEGDVKYLTKAGEKFGFGVEVINPVKFGSKIVNSTAVRQCLEEGDVVTAKGMMGRPYVMGGEVVKGIGLGRKLGVPTANVKFNEQKQLPCRGVYAAYVECEGQRYKAVVNIGFKPTIPQKAPQIVLEAHIFDFSGDIYGKHLGVEFFRFLRPEKKFGDVKELVKQMQNDIAIAENILK